MARFRYDLPPIETQEKRQNAWIKWKTYSKNKLALHTALMGQILFHSDLLVKLTFVPFFATIFSKEVPEKFPARTATREANCGFGYFGGTSHEDKEERLRL
jgi:hypothetical protein